MHQTIHNAVELIIDKQRRSAAASPYDRKVCIGAVVAAYDCFASIPQRGSADEYLASLLAAMTLLRDTYYDVDGEFTSGASEIGSIVMAMQNLET